MGVGMHHRKASAMSNVGVDISWDTRRYPVRRPPSTIVTTVSGNAASSGKFDALGAGVGYVAVAVTSTSAAIAAPTMPAVFSRVAATTGVRFFSSGIHLSALRLIPPPAMNRSGQIAFSMATSTLVTSWVQRS